MSIATKDDKLIVTTFNTDTTKAATPGYTTTTTTYSTSTPYTASTPYTGTTTTAYPTSTTTTYGTTGYGTTGYGTTGQAPIGNPPSQINWMNICLILLGLLLLAGLIWGIKALWDRKKAAAALKPITPSGNGSIIAPLNPPISPVGPAVTPTPGGIGSISLGRNYPSWLSPTWAGGVWDKLIKAGWNQSSWEKYITPSNPGFLTAAAGNLLSANLPGLAQQYSIQAPNLSFGSQSAIDLAKGAMTDTGAGISNFLKGVGSEIKQGALDIVGHRMENQEGLLGY